MANKRIASLESTIEAARYSNERGEIYDVSDGTESQVALKTAAGLLLLREHEELLEAFQVCPGCELFDIAYSLCICIHECVVPPSCRS